MPSAVTHGHHARHHGAVGGHTSTPSMPSRYVQGKSIGTGSYGNVYHAYDTVTGRNVAVKRVKRVFEDLVDCKRILREIAILSRVDDPHIVKLYDIVVPNDLYNFEEILLVMELCDSDIKKLINMPQFITEQHAIILLYNTLCALKYLHSCDIYHRDLKPANCLVMGDCSIKVCDFGLSRALGGEKGRMANRQLTGHVVTRWYRAPELILLQEQYTEQIDVWSLGCIFAELLGMVEGNIPHRADRCPLFQGGSCFPLSPGRRDDMRSKDHLDQLTTIFNVLGTPTREEIERMVSQEDLRKYVAQFGRKPKVNLADLDRFRATSPEALDLLTRMLTFDPRQRISVEEALEHRLFFGVRKKDQERCAPQRYRDKGLMLEFEGEEELDERTLRKYFLLEIKRFHPDLEIPPTFLWR